MITIPLHYDGLVTIRKNGKALTANVLAHGTYYLCEGGREPASEEFTVNDCELTFTEDEDGNPFEVTPELTEAFRRGLTGSDMQWDDWKDDDGDSFAGSRNIRVIY